MRISDWSSDVCSSDLRQLKRVDDTQDLVEVAARRRRIGDDQLHLLVRPYDEHRAYRHLRVGVGVDHSIQVGHGTIRIGDDRKVDRLPLRLLDRSEERGGGKEGVSMFRTRGGPYP